MIDARSLSASTSTSKRERSSSTPASAISSRTSTLGRAFTASTVRARAERRGGRADLRLILYEVKRQISHERSRLYFLYRVGLWCPRCRPAQRPFRASPDSPAHERRREAREASRRLGARPQAQPGRAPEEGEGAARDPRRAAGADRRGLRERGRGGHRPPPVVGPLPRQAEDRDVHAPREGAGREALAARAARDRRGLEPLRQGRRRALDAAEHPAALARAREAARRLRAPRGARASTTAGGCGDTVRNITGCPVQGLAADELFDCDADRRRGRRRSSTATPTGPTCRASTSTRSPRAPTAATRRRSTASR